MKIYRSLFLNLLIFAGCTPCANTFNAIFAPERCLNPTLTFTSTRIIPVPATCVGVPLSRKLKINCPASSGTAAACTLPSDGSSYYFIFLPNNGAGVFIDSVAGVINNCGELWIALASATPPADIVGGYFSNPVTDLLTCSDGTGCAGTSTSCISSWNTTTLSPTGTAITLPSGKPLLICGFIDVPQGGVAPPGPPPAVGSKLPSVSIATQFKILSVPPAGDLNFNSWFDY